MAFKDRSFSPLKYSTIFPFVLLLFSTAVVAQTLIQPKQFKFNPEIDASIGPMGEMTISRDATKVVPQIPGSFEYFIKTQSSSTSAGGLFTFHSAIKPYLGFNVNFNYSQFKQSFSVGGGTASINGGNPIITGYSDVGSLNTRMYELTASYAFEGPRFKRFRTFGQFGGGGLFFQPISAYFAKEETRPAMLFGVGTEYNVSRHFSIRAEYRGLLYKDPNYQTYSTGNYPQQRLFTVTNVPAISFVYRFRSSSNQKQLAKTQ
jgi:opacity protein-like surface antigen